MKINATIDINNAGEYWITTTNIPGTITGTGKNLEDAKQDLQNAIQETITAYTENGKDIPEYLQDATVDYYFTNGAFLTAFQIINSNALARYIGMNESQMRHYKKGMTISERQLARIENGVHQLAGELQQIRLTRAITNNQ